MTRKTGRSILPALIQTHPAWVLFGIALLLRIVQLVFVYRQPGFDLPIVDEVHFDIMARNLADGTTMHDGPFFRPPLWSILLAGPYKLFGQHFFLARFLNTILGSLAVTASFRLGKRLFHQRVAFTGALIFACQGFFIHNSTTGLASTLLVYLSLEALQVTLYARNQNRLRYWLIAGLLWGLAAIAKPVVLVPVVVILCDTLFRKTATAGYRQKTAALFVLGLLLPIMPVTLRNSISGDAVLVSSNGGINLYMGNNEQANGVIVFHPVLGVGWTETNAHSWAESETGYMMSPSEASSWYTQQAVQFWFYQPKRAFKLILDKAYYTFSGLIFTNNGNLGFYAKSNLLLRSLLPLGWGAVFPFALVGMVLAFRRSGNHRLTMLVAFSYLGICILFFVLARFRLPAEGILVHFAAYTGWFLLGREEVTQQASGKIRLLISLVVVLLALPVNMNLKGMSRSIDYAHSYYLNGQLLAREHRYSEAAQAFRDAIALNKRIPLSYLYLGQVMMKMDSTEQAINYFKHEIATLPKTQYFSDLVLNAQANLGRAYMKVGDKAEAERTFREARQIYGGDPGVNKYLTSLILERTREKLVQDDWNTALENLEEAATINPNEPALAFAFAVARFHTGSPEHANHIMAIILKHHPDYSPAQRWRDQEWRPDSHDIQELLLPFLDDGEKK